MSDANGHTPDQQPAGIRCVRCGCADLRCVRTIRMANRIKRYKRCRYCGAHITSYEVLPGHLKPPS